jgi:hypothetical protein
MSGWERPELAGHGQTGAFDSKRASLRLRARELNGQTWLV